jgi:hypothetical protein
MRIGRCSLVGAAEAQAVFDGPLAGLCLLEKMARVHLAQKECVVLKRAWFMPEGQTSFR